MEEPSSRTVPDKPVSEVVKIGIKKVEIVRVYLLDLYSHCDRSEYTASLYEECIEKLNSSNEIYMYLEFSVYGDYQNRKTLSFSQEKIDSLHIKSFDSGLLVMDSIRHRVEEIVRCLYAVVGESVHDIWMGHNDPLGNILCVLSQSVWVLRELEWRHKKPEAKILIQLELF